jgi:hypothetical protein
MSRTAEIHDELSKRLADQRRLLGLPKPTQMSTLELLQELLLATAKIQQIQHGAMSEIMEGLNAILEEALPGRLISPPGPSGAHSQKTRDQESDEQKQSAAGLKHPLR